MGKAPFGEESPGCRFAADWFIKGRCVVFTNPLSNWRN
jgi:hypothetical protein